MYESSDELTKGYAPEGILKSIVNYFNKVIPPILGVACRNSDYLFLIVTL